MPQPARPEACPPQQGVSRALGTPPPNFPAVAGVSSDLECI